MIVRSQDGATVLDTRSVAAFVVQGSSIYAHLKGSSMTPRMYDEDFPLSVHMMEENRKSANLRLNEFYAAWYRADDQYPVQSRTISFQF